MFKLIFAALIAFFVLWFANKQYIPEQFRDSVAGNVVNSALLPVEYKIARLAGKELKPVSSMVNIDAARMYALISSLVKVNKDTVVFLYDSNSYFSRYVLKGINDLAKQYQKPQKAVFLVMAFDDDKEKLTYMLKDLGKLHFRPIYTSASNIKDATAELKKNNITVSGVPAVVFKDSSTGIYENITPDFGSRKVLFNRINKN